MKRWRAVYYSLAGFWLLAALTSGQRIFFLLFAIQFILALFALLMNLWAALSFTYLQELSQEKSLHGQPIRLRLDIHNEQILPYPMMKIRLATPVWQEQRELNFNLPARSHLSFDLTMQCPYRGQYDIGMTVIDFVDIFGLIRLPFDMRLLPYYRMKQLLVYPRLEEIEALPLPTRTSQAFARHRFATEDQNEPFSTLRRYQAGDTRKRIHWPVTVRLQTLMTRQFEEAAEPQILLILDLSPSDWPGEAALQAADALCESAAGLMHYLLRQNYLLNLTAIGAQTEQRQLSRLAEFQAQYNWLAMTEFSGSGQQFIRSLALILEQSRSAQAILVVTTHADREIADLLLRQHRAGRPVFALFAGPIQSSADEERLQHQLQQAGLITWRMHYGDTLSRQLTGPLR